MAEVMGSEGGINLHDILCEHRQQGPSITGCLHFDSFPDRVPPARRGTLDSPVCRVGKLVGLQED